MSKPKFDNYYDVVYKTIYGRARVVKRVPAKTSNEAKEKVKKQMKSSKTFDGIVTVVKL